MVAYSHFTISGGDYLNRRWLSQFQLIITYPVRLQLRRLAMTCIGTHPMVILSSISSRQSIDPPRVELGQLPYQRSRLPLHHGSLVQDKHQRCSPAYSYIIACLLRDCNSLICFILFFSRTFI